MPEPAQSDPHDEPYSWVVSVPEAARIARCRESTIVDAINDGHLPAHRLSGSRRWRIMREDLPVWLRQQSQRRSDP